MLFDPTPELTFLIWEEFKLRCLSYLLAADVELFEGIAEVFDGLICLILWMAASNFMLSTGFTELLLIVCTLPLLDFLRTIKEDSEISAEAAPFLLPLALLVALESPPLAVEVDVFWLRFLPKHPSRYGFALLTTLRPLRLGPTEPELSLELPPANPEGE